MLRRALYVTMIVMGLGACSSADSHEGDACTKTDDCGGDLSCQPIQGRQANYCCPAPATASKNANCQPTG